MGPTERGLVMLAKLKVMTLLLVMVAGFDGKLLRVRVLRLGVLVIVAKDVLVTTTDINSVGRMKTMVSWKLNALERVN